MKEEQEVLTLLRAELVQVVTQSAELQMIVKDSGFPEGRIPWTGTLEIQIESVLSYGHRADPGLIRRLLDKFQERYPKANRLKKLAQTYWEKYKSKEMNSESAPGSHGQRSHGQGKAKDPNHERALISTSFEETFPSLLSGLITTMAQGGAAPAGIVKLDQRRFLDLKRTHPLMIVKTQIAAPCSYHRGLARYFQAEYADQMVQGYLPKLPIRFGAFFQKHFGLQAASAFDVPDGYFLFINGRIAAYHPCSPELDDEKLLLATGAAALSYLAADALEEENPEQIAAQIGGFFLDLDEIEQDLVRYFESHLKAHGYHD